MLNEPKLFTQKFLDISTKLVMKVAVGVKPNSSNHKLRSVIIHDTHSFTREENWQKKKDAGQRRKVQIKIIGF